MSEFAVGCYMFYIHIFSKQDIVTRRHHLVPTWTENKKERQRIQAGLKCLPTNSWGFRENEQIILLTAPLKGWRTIITVD